MHRYLSPADDNHIREKKRDREKGEGRERERELDSFGSYKVYFSLTIAVPRTARKSQEAGTQRRAISVIK